MMNWPPPVVEVIRPGMVVLVVAVLAKTRPLFVVVAGVAVVVEGVAVAPPVFIAPIVPVQTAPRGQHAT